MLWLKSSPSSLGAGDSVPDSQPTSFLQSDQTAGDPEHWLSDTPLLQIHHQKIRLLAARLTQLKRNARQKALACFAVVHKLPFDCSADGTSMSATDVLRLGMGDCHTKGTLLVALLRASGVPSRLRFVTLKSDFLYGLLDMKDQPVEHAMAEAWIDGRWVATDSYVVDNKLALAAHVKLVRERRTLGWGMHLHGNVTWDGQHSAFGQFNLADTASLPVHDWGAFNDPHQFYSAVPSVRKRLYWTHRAVWAMGSALVNRRVRVLRASLDKPPSDAKPVVR